MTDSKLQQTVLKVEKVLRLSDGTKYFPRKFSSALIKLIKLMLLIEQRIHCTDTRFGSLLLLLFFCKILCGIFEFRFSFEIIGSKSPRHGFGGQGTIGCSIGLNDSM